MSSLQRFDRAVILVGLFLLGPALFYLWKLEPSETATVEQLVPPAEADRVRALRRRFGAESDLLLVSVSSRAPLSMERIEVLEAVIAAAQGVENVWSERSRPRLGLSRSGALSLTRGPSPVGEPSALDRLLRPDQRTALFVVTLGPESETLSESRAILARLEIALQAALEPSESFRRVGFPAQRVASWEEARRDARLVVPLLVLVALGVPLYLFRSLAAALIPLLLGAIGSSLTLLLYRLWEGRLEPWALVLVPVVWAVATMDTLHLYQSTLKRRLAGDPDPVGGAVRELAGPCFWTALITVVSLLSLAAPGGPPLFRVFGVWGAVGGLLSFALSFLLVPALLRRTLRDGAPAAKRALPALRLERPLRRLLAASERRPFLVAGVWLLGATLALSQLGSLRTESRYEKPFVSAHPFARDLAAVRQAAGSDLVPIEIYLEARRGSEKDPADLLAATVALHEYLDSFRETRLSLSAATLIGELLESDPKAKQALRRLGRSESARERLTQLVGDPRLRPWVDRDRTTTRTVWMLRPTSFDRKAELLRFVEHYGKTMLDGRRLRLGGVGYLYQTAEAAGQTAITWGMLGDVALLALLLALAFRRLRIVLSGLLGNLVPVALLGGIMVLFQVPWTLGLLGLPIIALGLAADDTVHLLWTARDRSLPLCTALSRAHRRHGAAVIGTSLLLSGSLATLAVSDLAASRALGLLFPTAILLGLLAEVTLVPALLRLRLSPSRRRRRAR